VEYIREGDNQLYKIYLSELYYWLKNLLRDFSIQANNVSNTTKTELKVSRLIKSFEFTNPKKFQVHITYLFNDLRDRKFIDNKTDPKQLERVFSNTIIEKPIKWVGGLGDLKLLLHCMVNKDIIVDPKRRIWDITRACFIKEDGSLIKNSDIRLSKETIKASEIRHIVSKFLN